VIVIDPIAIIGIAVLFLAIGFALGHFQARR